MWSQDLIQEAVKFAAEAHNGQRVPGADIPYVVHVCQVAMEVMSSPAAEDLAVLCALLHDTLEDTEITFDDVAGAFGSEVAAGVQALTKDESLPREEQMADSLVRIKRQPKQVWMVKLADRITNLQEPPHYWNQDKRQAYRAEAWTILTELRDGDALLAGRLERKIQDYGRYLEEP